MYKYTYYKDVGIMPTSLFFCYDRYKDPNIGAIIEYKKSSQHMFALTQKRHVREKF